MGLVKPEVPVPYLLVIKGVTEPSAARAKEQFQCLHFLLYCLAKQNKTKQKKDLNPQSSL